MAINSVDNPYLQQILAQNLSSSNINPNKLQDSSKLLSSAVKAQTGIATISSNGAKINQISNQIKSSGDLQAFKGFQNAMGSLSESSDPLQMIKFSTSMSVLGQHDNAQLVTSFSNIAKAANNYGKGTLSSFTNLLTKTMEKTGSEGVASLNSIFKGVTGADYSNSNIDVKQNIEGMFKAVNSALSEKDVSKANANLSLLSKGIELKPSADSIWNFFNDYIG